MSAGLSLPAWEEQLRAEVQAQLELAVMRLSQAVPALLDDGGPKFIAVDVTLPLPGDERLRFRASLELVE